MKGYLSVKRLFVLADVVFPLYREESEVLVKHNLWELKTAKGTSLFYKKPTAITIKGQRIVLVDIPSAVALAHFQEKIEACEGDKLVFECNIHIEDGRVIVEVNDEPLGADAVENIQPGVRMFF
ncbi:hypothetical protein [Thermococcus sp. MAR1]|uniref:hypothetical protein n=1 Tax=Thermococcus sp. MAR1 TaxID=1638263 RepID=UPI001438FC43|nr:hypothetical protein [Thermococcus sp. MAR1]NJE09347.1 hypothetical protein [Thermococcus sp. MAR1]